MWLIVTSVYSWVLVIHPSGDLASKKFLKPCVLIGSFKKIDWGEEEVREGVVTEGDTDVGVCVYVCVCGSE